MIQVTVHEAKTQLSKLLARVAAGEEVMISRYGRPAARLVPCRGEEGHRRGGQDRGLFEVPDDFNDELPGLSESFEQ
jgi:prevent-host-death family protein